jgi:hypothetical protein
VYLSIVKALVRYKYRYFEVPVLKYRLYLRRVLNFVCGTSTGTAHTSTKIFSTGTNPYGCHVSRQFVVQLYFKVLNLVPVVHLYPDTGKVLLFIDLPGTCTGTIKFRS